LSQAPEHVKGEEWEKFITLGFHDPCTSFSKAPERVKGEGL
jgi:hypothetical protein